MDSTTKTYIAAVADVQIYAEQDCGFILTIDIIQDSHIFEFGGSELFSAAQCEGNPEYFLHFLSRCMYIGQVCRLNDLIGTLIKIQLQDLSVTGIASLKGNEWFYPLTEFESLKNEIVKDKNLRGE